MSLELTRTPGMLPAIELAWNAMLKALEITQEGNQKPGTLISRQHARAVCCMALSADRIISHAA